MKEESLNDGYCKYFVFEKLSSLLEEHLRPVEEEKEGVERTRIQEIFLLELEALKGRNQVLTPGWRIVGVGPLILSDQFYGLLFHGFSVRCV